MLHIQILIFNGFDELDAIAPFEVLQLARASGAELKVELVALEGLTQITAAHGLNLQPSARLDPEQHPEILIVPGGGWLAGSEQGARAEIQRGMIPALIKHWHSQGTTIAAVCTGAMLLAAAGLLTQRPAITHQGAIAALEATGATIVQARVVDDGDLITAGGITAGLDLALWLLERYLGIQTSQKIATILEYERQGSIWRRSPGS